MNYYGVIFSQYWTGETGRQLRAQGGKDAQLLGAYLFSNDYMNMIGLYQLKVLAVRDELGLTAAAVAKAFEVTQRLDYAFYDTTTAFVWVREMARFRLNIQDESPLKRDDKKAIGARQLYERLPVNPWLGPFFDRYAKALHLKHRRATPQPVGLQ